MLKLVDIVKEYKVGDTKTIALKGVSITFKQNEFVSILGPSGCGKTTLLNIIGGLDQYTSGDLIINDLSTKKYKDSDWDAYRNNSIGFVFQSYNLIPHQNVLSNVELALTLSGVSKKERRKRAVEALEKVGLKDQLHKKPNQMSGGQMQRVAIARALVNNPDILLADEPTGALDTETSEQIMKILSEVAKEKLVIMVTHNPELALQYSTRIIRLLDGNIIADSAADNNELDAPNPYASQSIRSLEAGGPKHWSFKTKEEKEHEVHSFADVEEPHIAYEPIPDYTDKEIKALKKQQKQEELEEKKAIKLQKNAEKNKIKNEKLQKKLEQEAKRPKKTSMKLSTALSLSFNNLLTKKGRTFLTAFAGSIGIIGISLILSLSNGVQLYIDSVEEDTLSSYPLTVEKNTIDVTSFMSSMQQSRKEVEEHTDDKIYTNQIMVGFMDMMLKQVETNDLSAFKKYLENNESKFEPLTSDIQYVYSTKMNIYKSDISSGLYKVNPAQIFSSFGMGSSRGMGMYSSTDVWQRLIDNDDLLKDQYEVIYGKMPEHYDEVALIVSGNNEVTDYTLYALGILDSEELSDTFRKMAMGQDVSFPEPKSYTYEELAAMRFKLLCNSDYFKKEGNIWVNKKDDEVYLIDKLNNSLEIKVVGILKSSSDAAMSGNLAGTIGYRDDLMTYLINKVNDSEIVKEQKDNPDIDVFTGLKFSSDEAPEVTMEMLYGMLATMPEDQQAEYNASIEQMRSYGMDDDAILQAFASAMTQESSDATYEGNLRSMGVSNLDEPSAINIFPKDFEAKDSIADLIAEYNDSVDEAEKITYTDYVGLIMSSVSTIINAISYILIAFVAISLIVSSIMIGIITYISVLERTKEIGILRAIGASKRDISRVFNAETLIIGFTAGALGIIISELLLIPINSIIYSFTDIRGIAVMPNEAAVILVLISMFLTLIAGLFPSRIAAKKDPVVALRTE